MKNFKNIGAFVIAFFVTLIVIGWCKMSFATNNSNINSPQTQTQTQTANTDTNTNTNTNTSTEVTQPQTTNSINTTNTSTQPTSTGDATTDLAMSVSNQIANRIHKTMDDVDNGIDSIKEENKMLRDRNPARKMGEVQNNIDNALKK